MSSPPVVRVHKLSGEYVTEDLGKDTGLDFSSSVWVNELLDSVAKKLDCVPDQLTIFNEEGLALLPHTLTNLSDGRARDNLDPEVVELSVVIEKDPLETHMALNSGFFSFEEMLSFPGGWAMDLAGVQMNRFPRRIGQVKCSALNAIHAGLLWLPSEMCDMRGLQKLELQSNYLAGLPRDFGRLESLEELDLMNNRLGNDPLPGTKGEAFLKPIPESFKDLKKLKVLKLSCNPLKEFPEPICKLSGLEALVIADAGLKKLPTNFGELKTLKLLVLSKNPLEDLPESLHCLRELIHINLEETPVSQDFKKVPQTRLILAFMARMYRLQEVVIQKGQRGLPDVIKVIVERIHELLYAGVGSSDGTGGMLETLLAESER